MDKRTLALKALENLRNGKFVPRSIFLARRDGTEVCHACALGMLAHTANSERLCWVRSDIIKELQNIGFTEVEIDSIESFFERRRRCNEGKSEKYRECLELVAQQRLDLVTQGERAEFIFKELIDEGYFYAFGEKEVKDKVELVEEELCEA